MGTIKPLDNLPKNHHNKNATSLLKIYWKNIDKTKLLLSRKLVLLVYIPPSLCYAILDKNFKVF